MIEFEEMPQIKRPIGVSILAMLLGLYASLLPLIVIWSLLHTKEVRAWFMTTHCASFIAERIVFLGPIEAAFAAIVAYNLWTLQNWARHGAALLAALIFYPWARSFAIVMVLALTGSQVHVSTAFLTAILGVLAVLIYLNSSGVRRAFRLAADVRAPDYRSRQNDRQTPYTGR